MQQSQLMSWKNSEGNEIVIMITDRDNIGVVVHSDGLMSVGTVVDIDKMELRNFIGTVHIKSAAQE
jgi:hypothetical protein